MVKKNPYILLAFSILFLAGSIITLLKGSDNIRLFAQMRDSQIIEDYNDLISMGNKPFLLYGYIDKDHPVIYNGMIAYQKLQENNMLTQSPNLEIMVGNNKILLKDGYTLSDFNTSSTFENSEYRGIKPGIDITIYAINYKNDTFSGIKGHELYPGNPKQYKNFLEKPYQFYMTTAKTFIGIALLLFIISMVLNIKK